MAQNFVQVVTGPVSTIEERCNAAFLDLFERGLKVAHTRYIAYEGGFTACFISYYNPD